ncbi:MAG: CHAT domain-containing protein, partial [Cyanobacteria bacterium J06642_2]
MTVLYVTLESLSDDWVELRYRIDDRMFEPQQRRLSEIQNLLALGEKSYYSPLPDFGQVGRQLFSWLDGDGRWLSRAIADCSPSETVVAIAAAEKLAHLPWEVMHDGTNFLVDRFNPAVAPVRWVEGKADEYVPQDRALQVLFMATSPDGVTPVLEFEREEARLLGIADELPLDLRVEESGCVEELGKLWRRFGQGSFDVFHLTGHASIQRKEPHQPYFVTESLTGEPLETTAAELARAFEGRLPRLAFLSGCKTGQAGDEGGVSSMAEALVRGGVPAVLGWGKPVLDREATDAAGHLYRGLAAGFSVAAALGRTFRQLRQDESRDWHLLRLYVRGPQAWQALVEPAEDYVPTRAAVREQFLDPEKRVRVATPDEFVGRRKILQQGLRHLRSKRCAGVVLHGLGGVGKSTIAARLLERLPQEYTPLVVYRRLSWEVLQRLLGKQCLSETGHEILAGGLPLAQKLTRFLKDGLNESKQKFCFVLDDFEANVETNPDGKPVLKADVVEAVSGLLQAVQNCGVAHRVILTSRYDVRFPEGDAALERLRVPALRGADLEKKCNRLEAFQARTEVEKALRLRAREIADGNPRLLEWLDRVLVAEGLDRERILARMGEEEQRFRESILARELLAQQAEGVKALLGRALVFALPVPGEALAAVAKEIEAWERHRERAVALGLLEVDGKTGQPHYRVPLILSELLSDFRSGELYDEAVEVLNQLWWQEAEGASEEQLLEIHRLALLAGNAEIAGDMGGRLANRWNEQNRYRESAELCKSTLVFARDSAVYYNLAQAQVTLGEVSAALSHYQLAHDALDAEGNVQGKAATLHEMAYIYVQQGQVSEALELYQQSLQLQEQIGNVKGKAATLHEMAYIYVQQGQVSEALE